MSDPTRAAAWALLCEFTKTCDTRMERGIVAADELSGFVGACALVS